MQNTQTLEQLGFQQEENGNWIYQGKHRLFRANVWEPNSKYAYVWLHVNCGKIDERPLSPNKGKPLWNDCGDCGSDGSVKKRIERFDKPL